MFRKQENIKEYAPIDFVPKVVDDLFWDVFDD